MDKEQHWIEEDLDDDLEEFSRSGIEKVEEYLFKWLKFLRIYGD